MGIQMTKELGVYNEEEKVCTPLGPQRYRQLKDDPRSVSAGIVRTPIQVECTPTGVKTIHQKGTRSIPKSRCTPEDTQNITDRIEKVECTPTGVKAIHEEDTESVSRSRSSSSEDIQNVSGDRIDEVIVIEDTVENVVPVDEKTNVNQQTETKYLETDIDKLDSPVAEQLASTSGLPTLTLQDVRSPSVEINRTPIVVECTPELLAIHSQIDSLSFCDFDVQVEDPSVIVSEDEQTFIHNQSTVKNWLTGLENKDGDPPCDTSFTDSPRQVAKKQKELNALKKQLFFTPVVTDMGKPKVRTPLGDIQACQRQESPQKLMRNKHWRNIQEERQRRGLVDTENTPPNLPPLSTVASAPGKILNRKRSKTSWDEDNTMFI